VNKRGLNLFAFHKKLDDIEHNNELSERKLFP
jgi:hypothetical protein